MALRIGINGFGRIGRLALRAMVHRKGMECVGINDLVPPSQLAHLFKYDSAHGQFQGALSAREDAILVNAIPIPVVNKKDPAEIPWKSLGADIVLECTGLFTTLESGERHRSAGAKNVIISAPAKGEGVATFVYGVNHTTYRPSLHHVISNASCTTNCLAPIVKILHETFGVERGFMTTIHSYTNDQCVVDAPHKDPRRARAAAVSQIPTTTGAARAVGLVLPELRGKLDGMAIRVPTINVSCVDLVAVLKKRATVEEINGALRGASQGALNGILSLCDEECVSVDFMGNTHSSIVDAPSTRVIDTMVKILAWYDNEIGFCHRMLDVAEYVGKQL